MFIRWDTSPRPSGGTRVLVHQVGHEPSFFHRVGHQPLSGGSDYDHQAEQGRVRVASSVPDRLRVPSHCPRRAVWSVTLSTGQTVSSCSVLSGGRANGHIQELCQREGGSRLSSQTVPVRSLWPSPTVPVRSLWPSLTVPVGSVAVPNSPCRVSVAVPNSPCRVSVAVPNSPCRVSVAVPKSPYGLCGRP